MNTVVVANDGEITFLLNTRIPPPPPTCYALETKGGTELERRTCTCWFFGNVLPDFRWPISSLSDIRCFSQQQQQAAATCASLQRLPRENSTSLLIAVYPLYLTFISATATIFRIHSWPLKLLSWANHIFCWLRVPASRIIDLEDNVLAMTADHRSRYRFATATLTD